MLKRLYKVFTPLKVFNINPAMVLNNSFFYNITHEVAFTEERFVMVDGLSPIAVCITDAIS